jgi:hypothetical protein
MVAQGFHSRLSKIPQFLLENPEKISVTFVIGAGRYRIAGAGGGS